MLSLPWQLVLALAVYSFLFSLPIYTSPFLLFIFPHPLPYSPSLRLSSYSIPALCISYPLYTILLTHRSIQSQKSATKQIEVYARGEILELTVAVCAGFLPLRGMRQLLLVGVETIATRRFRVGWK